MQLVAGAGADAAGHVGVVLVLDTEPGFAAADGARLLGERIRGVPRLRQRLYRGAAGYGRPYWGDDPDFDLGAHVREVRCPAPGDERALLDLSARLVCEHLPRERPLWAATFVGGLADGGTGLVIVMDHVLADGVAGLAMLAALLDAADDRGLERGQRAAPSAPSARLALPPSGLRGLAHAVNGVRKVRQGLAELGGARLPLPLPSSSLNQSTGPGRQLDVVTADLDTLREFAHAHGGTVNDVVLAAVAGALRDLLASRGEDLREVTMSVPVSARRAGDNGHLGNQVGLMPVTVPADGDLGERVRRVGATTRERKSLARGESAALFVPAFLLLARAGLLGWFVNHQRLVHTFVTNLRGPRDPLTFDGAPVRALIPIPSTTGNVTVTFGALSYAGTLRITVLCDPGRAPDVSVLTTALRHALDTAAR